MYKRQKLQVAESKVKEAEEKRQREEEAAEMARLAKEAKEMFEKTPQEGHPSSKYWAPRRAAAKDAEAVAAIIKELVLGGTPSLPPVAGASTAAGHAGSAGRVAGGRLARCPGRGVTRGWPSSEKSSSESAKESESVKAGTGAAAGASGAGGTTGPSSAKSSDIRGAPPTPDPDRTRMWGAPMRHVENFRATNNNTTRPSLSLLVREGFGVC